MITTTHPLNSKATDSPLPAGEGLGRRVEPVEMVRSTEKAAEMMKLTKRQIEVTMFAAGVGTLKGLKIGMLVEQSKDV